MAKKKQKKKKQIKKINRVPVKEKESREKASVGEYIANHKSLLIIGSMAFMLAAALISAYVYIITN